MKLNPKLSFAFFRAHNSAWVDTEPRLNGRSSIGDDRFTSTPAVSYAQFADGLANGSHGPAAAICRERLNLAIDANARCRLMADPRTLCTTDAVSGCSRY
jgi:hypothetical protein